jgi:succinate dehydrogenase / fumarate reductase iron-sulfur subunit
MRATFRIQRYNPEADAAPHFVDYTLDNCEPTMRILDVLHEIKWKQDGTLTFRRSCAHGMCGSDGMKINGRNGLACSLLLKNINLKKIVTIEPLPSLPIIKDLVVDTSTFFQKYELVKPYLITKSPNPERERLQSNENAELLFEAAKCIQCGSCSSSCPSLWGNDAYLGPAAMLKAFRFVFDTRDEGAAERLDIVDTPDGLWRCHTIFNCVEVCPKEINITWHLSQLKKMAVEREI